MLKFEFEDDKAILYETIEKGHFFLNPFWKIFYVIFIKETKKFKVVIFSRSAVFLDTEQEVEDYINSYDEDGRIIYDYSAKHNIPIHYHEARKLIDIIEHIEGKKSFGIHYNFNGYMSVFYDKKEVILMNKIISIEMLEDFISSFNSTQKINFPLPYELKDNSVVIKYDGESKHLNYINCKYFDQLLQEMKEFK